MINNKAQDYEQGTILVAGSLCFDLIMNFKGKFRDHILPEKLDSINLSFLVDKSRKERGGCAGNICYSLALLGEHPRMVAAAGSDFEAYSFLLMRMGVDVSHIATFEDELTATCTITSDANGNQLTFVCTGAMSRAREIDMSESFTPATKLAIIAPDDPPAMQNHPESCRQHGIPFIYDPSFQVIAFDGKTLMNSARGAKVLIMNDYEFALFQEKTGQPLSELRKQIELIVVTKGGEGSTIYTKDEDIAIKAAKINKVADPTGAGDAFRAGLIYGLIHNCTPLECGQMGAICGAYAVESVGTQNFSYTKDEFRARYQENFGSAAPLK